MYRQVSTQKHTAKHDRTGQVLIALGMAVILALIAGAVYMAVQARSSAAPTPATAMIQPAEPVVLTADAHRQLLVERAYLKAQQPALAPEQAGVQRYLHVHGAAVTAPGQVRAMEPNAQAVFDYLRAHGW